MAGPCCGPRGAPAAQEAGPRTQGAPLRHAIALARRLVATLGGSRACGGEAGRLGRKCQLGLQRGGGLQGHRSRLPPRMPRVWESQKHNQRAAGTDTAIDAPNRRSPRPRPRRRSRCRRTSSPWSARSARAGTTRRRSSSATAATRAGTCSASRPRSRRCRTGSGCARHAWQQVRPDGRWGPQGGGAAF